jgi:hypothetical protein
LARAGAANRDAGHPAKKPILGVTALHRKRKLQVQEIEVVSAVGIEPTTY